MVYHSTILMAIDPGMSGALAIQQADVTSVTKMPESPVDLYHTLNNIAKEYPVYCLCEKVGGYRPGNSGPAAAKFARHVGHVEMALIAANIQHSFVAPSKWMRTMFPSAPTGTDAASKRDRKNYIKDMMQRRHPDLKVSLWGADALGLLAYLVTHDKELGVI